MIREPARALKILIVEDAATDAELMESELRRSGVRFVAKRVDTRGAFTDAIEAFKPDIVLCDYALPDFTGADALEHVRRTHPEISAVMVTGALGDERAIELMKAGARDYVLKDNLARLPSSVREAISTQADIRARKAAETALLQSEERFRGLAEAAEDGIIVVDSSGSIVYWNPACTRVLGYSAEEAKGRKAHEWLAPPRFRQAAADGLATLAASDQGRVLGKTLEAAALTKDGGEIPIELSIAAFRQGGQWQAIGIWRDITERKKTEKELRDAYQGIKAANKELAEFAYAASHDLRAPLRVIDNASKWLEEDLQAHLDEQTRENMRLLRGRVARMERLLDALLEYSQVGRVTDERYTETISGKELMDDIIGLSAQPAGFEIRIGPGFADIRVHRMPLQQVLVNLVGNAIKHHHRRDSGRVEVTVEDSGDFYAFAVKDDGPGIPARFHEEVFKMFQTLKPRDQVEGSGMGLAIVRKNIEVYGGTLALESDEGKGSAFRFTWPKPLATPKRLGEQVPDR